MSVCMLSVLLICLCHFSACIDQCFSNSRGRDRAVSEGEQKRQIKGSRRREWVVSIKCVCEWGCSSTCTHRHVVFPSLSQTQTVRTPDNYSINCQHNQHQYVWTLTSNTTNAAETEAAVSPTPPSPKCSLVVQRKSECSMLNWQQLSCQCEGFDCSPSFGSSCQWQPWLEAICF